MLFIIQEALNIGRQPQQSAGRVCDKSQQSSQKLRDFFYFGGVCSNLFN